MEKSLKNSKVLIKICENNGGLGNNKGSKR
jgi:hypothetical protein